jgi:hypothetical protein
VIRAFLAWGAVVLVAACHSSTRTAPAPNKAGTGSEPKAATAARPSAPAVSSPAVGGATAEVERATIDGYGIALAQNRLTVTTSVRDSRVFTLESAVPCRLHRDTAGKVRSASVVNAKVLLIECATETMRSADGKRRLCETKIHGLVLSSGGPSLAGRTQSVGMCPPFQWDDHMFAFFGKG